MTTSVLPDDWDYEDWQPAAELAVPDWNERWLQDDYKRLAWWQIAWGFLRHLPDYQEDWALDFGARFNADGSLGSPLHDRAKGYGLQRAIDPSVSAFGLTENPFSSPELIILGPKKQPVTLASHEALVRLNLSKPLEPQLRALKRRLPSKPQSRARLRLNKYPAYLCLLDARASSATYAQIGAALYPKKEKDKRRDQLKNERRAVQELQSRRGYIDIALRGGK